MSKLPSPEEWDVKLEERYAVVGVSLDGAINSFTLLTEPRRMARRVMMLNQSRAGYGLPRPVAGVVHCDRDRKRMLGLLVADVTPIKGNEARAVHVRFRAAAARSLSLPRTGGVVKELADARRNRR